MYSVTKSIDIDFAHHVHGHPGACINIHGHTWKFEAELACKVLDDNGFVCDFAELKRRVLTPTHALLDHSLALGKVTVVNVLDELAAIGKYFVGTREERRENTPGVEYLNGAMNEYPGNIKIAVMPFHPTSERLAYWFWQLADAAAREIDRNGSPCVGTINRNVRCVRATVYETLHPVAAFATYRPDPA